MISHISAGEIQSTINNLSSDFPNFACLKYKYLHFWLELLMHIFWLLSPSRLSFCNGKKAIKTEVCALRISGFSPTNRKLFQFWTLIIPFSQLMHAHNLITIAQSRTVLLTVAWCGSLYKRLFVRWKYYENLIKLVNGVCVYSVQCACCVCIVCTYVRTGIYASDEGIFKRNFICRLFLKIMAIRVQLPFLPLPSDNALSYQNCCPIFTM